MATVDTRLPLLAAQGAHVDLAGLFRQQQEHQARQQQIQMQQERMDMMREDRSDEQQQRASMQQRQQAETIAKLTTGVQDDATYQQRLAAARQLGIDVSSAPTTYDPAWVQTQNTIATVLLRPEGQRELSTAAQQAQELTGLPIEHPQTKQVMARLLADNVSVQAGGSVFSNDPLQGLTPAVVPNTGGAPTGSPVGGPQPGAVVNGYVFKGGNPNDRNSWEPVGGAGGNASGTFQP